MRPNQTRHHVTSDTEQAGHTPSPRLRGVDGWIITWVPRDRGSRPGVWLLMFLALQSGNGVTSSLWADCSASALSCYFWKPCPPRVLFFISLETLLELLFCHFFLFCAPVLPSLWPNSLHFVMRITPHYFSPEASLLANKTHTCINTHGNVSAMRSKC